ncbi:MAG TPA: cytochrome c biogenesis protein ResB [Elusimicrobiales bacterium]|nr:cytochrome c biogenesis protein ResB [Elusimicrobiales bacterium]
MLKLLSSLQLFFSLCLALAAVFVRQTIFSRGQPPYGSWWFAALGVLLAMNITACALRRRKTATPAFLLIHAGIVLVIFSSFASRYARFEGSMPLRSGSESAFVYRGDLVYKLPFKVRLEDFRLEYYREPRGVLTAAGKEERLEIEAVAGAEIQLGGSNIKVLRLLRDFGLTANKEAVDKSPYWHNPAAQLEITTGGRKSRLWFFTNFPGMHREELPFNISYRLDRADIKNFTSSVLITPDDGHGFKGEISVNKPLRVNGYTLYQTSYDPADAGYSLLTAVRDQGLWGVYAGFAVLLAGILLWLKE